MIAALLQHVLGFAVLLVGDIEPAGELVALKLTQEVPMMLPFPGKAPRELEIIDAPAHRLELFEALAEIDVGDLRSGPRQCACALLKKFFGVFLRAIPEHGAAKANLEIIHRNVAQRFRSES